MEPRVGPYVDIMLSGPSLSELSQKTGLKYFTLAFALGSAAGCEPYWGGERPIDEPQIMENIKNFQKIGGKVAVALGGALGPYLETICPSVESLTNAYIKIMDVVKTNHLDIDIEASVSLDRVTKALKNVQDKRPETTVRFTLMVQGDDYGLTPELGVKLLEKARDNGLRVDIVNPMTMEFGTTRKEWGDAVIASLEATHGQMQKIWPSKSPQQLYSMLGATPMIGLNFNKRIFTQSHAEQLVNYALKTNLGYLGYWSVGRDNGDCPGGGISPKCSSIAQQPFEFARIFSKYPSKPDNKETVNEIEQKNHSKVTKKPSTTPTTISRSSSESTSTTSSSTTSSSTTTTTSTTTQTPEVVLGERKKVCKGFEDRFNEWCENNCRAGFCPEHICSCYFNDPQNSINDSPKDKKLPKKDDQ